MKTPDRVGQGLEGLLQLSEVALGFSPFEPWPENTFPLRIRPEGLRIQEKAGWDSMQHICHSARIRQKLQYPILLAMRDRPDAPESIQLRMPEEREPR